MSDLAVYVADPHDYGPGKTHIVDDGLEKTLCGRHLAAIAGHLATMGADPFLKIAKANKAGHCITCVNRYLDRPERERRLAAWRQESAERDRKRHDDNARWWQQYNAYLRSDAWRAKRAQVLERAQHLCEACGIARAVEAHHTTYKHVGREPLFELRAVCHSCHEQLHEPPPPSDGAPL